MEINGNQDMTETENGGHARGVPGHDYGTHPYPTIGKRKKNKLYLEQRTLEESIELMKQP